MDKEIIYFKLAKRLVVCQVWLFTDARTPECSAMTVASVGIVDTIAVLLSSL